jgi:phosphoribosylformylglycinamidine cyclo-ligase
MKISYKRAGVDVAKAEEFVKGIGRFLALKKGGTKAFGSLFDLSEVLKRYKHPLLVSSADGVGTKLKIAQELNLHTSVGVDLVAMNVNDIVCLGAKPLFFLDYIACGKLKPLVLAKVMQGIAQGLKQSDCLLLGGETAEMPGMYKKDEYDLAGFCVGVVERDKIIDGRRIKKDDAVIGIASSGLHSNGFSLVRKVFSRKERKRYAQELLRPTRIYVKPILSLLKARCYTLPAIKAVAHNTGGAFYTKITKVLPKGTAFMIEKDSWKVPVIFKLIKKKARLNDAQMYSTFNMGIGMVLVANKKYAGSIISFLGTKGFKAWVIGKVIAAKKKKIVLV